MHRADTQSISIDASVECVFDLVSDPTMLPRWAPAFARTIRADGDTWLVDGARGRARIRVRSSREHGTVDFLVAGAPAAAGAGAFSRVIANGRGAEYVFTRFLADATSAADLEDERAVVAVELQTVRALCERAGARRAA